MVFLQSFDMAIAEDYVVDAAVTQLGVVIEGISIIGWPGQAGANSGGIDGIGSATWVAGMIPSEHQMAGTDSIRDDRERFTRWSTTDTVDRVRDLHGPSSRRAVGDHVDPVRTPKHLSVPLDKGPKKRPGGIIIGERFFGIANTIIKRPPIGPIPDFRQTISVQVGVMVGSQSDLLNVVRTLDAGRRRSDFLDRRQQQANEHRDNRDDHEEFD
jgi:hypothetical protein